MKDKRGRDDLSSRERGREKDVRKERTPEHICGAAEGTALLLCDPEYDGKATEKPAITGLWMEPP